MNSFLSPSPLWQNKGVAIIRIVLGLLLIYHGKEIFDAELMNSYLKWDNFKEPSGKMLVYAGKLAEFIAGLSLTFGLFTRLGAIITIGTLSYVTFFIGHGKFWYEDQHPFMFVLLGVLFIFTGPGAWSLDHLLFKEKTSKAE